MNRLNVRQAGHHDCASLEGLIRQLGYDENAADIAARLAAMEEAGLAAFVAELDARVVGCLATSIMPVLHRPKPVGRISMMVVEEGLRSRGIGEQLVRAAEVWLKDRGCGLIEVTSNLNAPTHTVFTSDWVSIPPRIALHATLRRVASAHAPSR